jgi:hypothetical protein
MALAKCLLLGGLEVSSEGLHHHPELTYHVSSEI